MSTNSTLSQDSPACRDFADAVGGLGAASVENIPRRPDLETNPPKTDTPSVDSSQSWIERMQRDPSLRRFVEAEIARAGIQLGTLCHNVAHWKAVALSLDAKVRALERGRSSPKDESADLFMGADES